MSQTILIKRSSVSGKAPTTAQLSLGELALNTYDGKIFLKKSVLGVDSIVEIGAVTATGDVTGSGNGSITLTLSNTGVTAGTYPKVTVDAKGRVTSGSALSSTDIPALDWSKITSGKPTTLSGYGITDAVASNAAITAGTYRSVTVDTKGLVTAGTNPTTLAGYGITDASAINPATPKDGDVKVASGVISIYASGAWKQVFPAVYA